MIIDRTIPPGHKKYLPPAYYEEGEAPVRDCGEVAPQPPFTARWICTREGGHTGDHAAHAALSRTPDMVARWDRATRDDVGEQVGVEKVE